MSRDKKIQASKGTVDFHALLMAPVAKTSTTVADALSAARGALSQWIWYEETLPGNVHPNLETGAGENVASMGSDFTDRQKENYEEIDGHFNEMETKYG